jgi:Carboxypeptidase regulatory-like domain/TonB dependent receptor
MKNWKLWCVRTLSFRDGVVLFGLLACLLVPFASIPTYGQSVSGINGTVTDQSGAVVPDATVTITNVDTKVESHATTSAVGTYTVTDLIPGNYTVRVEKANFQTSLVQGVTVETGRFATADAVLKTGVATETVEVNSSSETLETEQPEIGTTVENKIVQEVPAYELTAGNARDRQIDAYLFLAPGVTGSSFSHQINGGVSFQNEVVFNGVVAVQSETQGYQTNINPPFEMVDEFRVQSSVFSAQYGLAQGVAQYQFASGTNTLHGDAFEILRNSYFDAPGASNDQFNNDKPNVDKENNFGFAVGGPVWLGPLYNGKDKTFFHVAADWYREKNNPTGTFTVPTPAMVGGDFSNFVQANTGAGSTTVIPIYIPAAWATNPGLEPAGCTPGAAPGQQWPGNKIPTDCFSTVSASLLSLIPTPNACVGTCVNNNMSAAATGITLPIKQANWGFTVDENLTARQSIHGSFWRDSQNSTNWDHNGFFTNELSAFKTEPRLGTGVFVTYSKVFSTNLVMTAGVGWMGELNDEYNTHQGVSFPGVQSGTVLPTINFGGPNGEIGANIPVQWGVNANGETFSINRKLGIGVDNNWLWTHGRHTMNIGWEVRRSYQDDHECQNCGGGAYFDSLITGDGNPADSNIAGSGFASYLLGDVSQVTRNFALENKLRNLDIAPYIQDNIKINPKLTLNAGVRWDIAVPFTDATRTLGTDTVVFFNPSIPNPGAIDPATGSPLAGGVSVLGTCAECVGYHRASIGWKHFSPRLGFVYELNNKTVFLGGYAVNFLDSGTYEYGVHKIAVNYGNWLAGLYNVPSFGTDVPAYGLWDTTSAGGTPAGPILAPGATPYSPTIANVSTPGAFYDTGQLPYVQAWNFGVQRELPGNMFLSVSYVGNRGIHLPDNLSQLDQLNPDILPEVCTPANGGAFGCALQNAWTTPANQAIMQQLGYASSTVACPNGGPSGTYFTPYVNFLCDWGTGQSLAQALRPYPQYNGIFNNFSQSGVAYYNAMQVQFQKRFSNGLSYLINYTLSREWSNTDSGFPAFNSGAINEYNRRAEWALSSNDQTHVINITAVYELPIGPGKKFLDKGGLIAKNIIGGWQISTFLTYQSNTPFGIGANGNPLLAGGNRANEVPGIPISVDWNNYYTSLGPNPQPIFTTAAFSNPGPWALGDSTRNVEQLRYAFEKNENIALAKKFFFGERVNAELRMEFYNIFNRFIVGNCLDENVSDDNTVTGSGNFGLSNPGQICQNNSPRQGQAYFTVRF